MNELLDFVKEFDIHNLFSIAIIFWLITRGWRNEVREEIKSIREEISQQGKRTDKLYEMYCEARDDSNKKWDEMNEKWVQTQMEIKNIYLEIKK